MKQKRILVVAQFVMGMLFITPSAQAFYNPSTGRWLSRDPIAEKGGLNLHSFVHNLPITLIDFLGKEPCVCGEDVTGAVSKTLSDISYYYHNRRGEQLSACKWIIGRGPRGIPAAFGAWSMFELASAGFPDGKKYSSLRLGECRGHHTVTFDGKCHFAGAVNYAMWGQIMRLCHDSAKYEPEEFNFEPADQWSLTSARVLVLAWLVQDGLPREITREKLAFTAYGYRRIPPAYAAPPGCGEPSSDSSKSSLNWWWDPIYPGPFYRGGR